MRKLSLRRAIEKNVPMADPPPYPGTPRWVRVFSIIGLVLVLVLVILLFSHGGPGGHGPGWHTGEGDTPPVEHGVQQPLGSDTPGGPTPPTEHGRQQL